MKKLTQFCNVYHFIQRMNRAFQMSSNYVRSVQIIKIVRNFRDAWTISSTLNKRIVYVIILITNVIASHGEAIIVSFHAQL